MTETIISTLESQSHEIGQTAHALDLLWAYLNKPLKLDDPMTVYHFLEGQDSMLALVDLIQTKLKTPEAEGLANAEEFRKKEG